MLCRPIRPAVLLQLAAPEYIRNDVKIQEKALDKDPFPGGHAPRPPNLPFFIIRGWNLCLKPTTE